jgi:hypothetical protein
MLSLCVKKKIPKEGQGNKKRAASNREEERQDAEKTMQKPNAVHNHQLFDISTQERIRSI